VSQVKIIIPEILTAQHLSLALKYFEKNERMSSQEWKIAARTFNILNRGQVRTGRSLRTFQQFYDRFVDRPYADDFLSQLVVLENPEQEGEVLQQRFAQEILVMLEREGLYHEEVVHSEYLAAYCLYWWTAFGMGYRFELARFRDLQAAGVDFIAHDIRRREERRSPYDLVILRQRGDIKTTTYFLYNSAVSALYSDFYITRLFHPQRRRYLDVVVMTEAAWHLLNGDTRVVQLDTAADFFPNPVLFSLEERNFVILPYELWKQKVIQRQQKTGDGE
jgi:hypothetical protein